MMCFCLAKPIDSRVLLLFHRFCRMLFNPQTADWWFQVGLGERRKQNAPDPSGSLRLACIAPFTAMLASQVL